MLSESESTARPLAELTDAELHAQLAHASKVVATVQAEIEQRAAERLQLHAERREIAAMQKRLEAELDGRAAKHQRRGSGPSGAGPSTPRTARGRDAVDLDEEPSQCVVTMQMRKVELGTFDYGACYVAFTEKAIRFYTNEAPRFQPKGYPEEIELEMIALSRIQIDKQRGLMCVTGSFEYAVPGHYDCISAANGPLSRALFHFDTSEGDGVWSGRLPSQPGPVSDAALSTHQEQESLQPRADRLRRRAAALQAAADQREACAKAAKARRRARPPRGSLKPFSKYKEQR